MSTSWNDNPISRDLLALGGLTIAMSQMAWLSPSLAGTGSFLMLMVAVALVAQRGDLRQTIIASLVAAGLATSVCWLIGSVESPTTAIITSMIGCAALALLSAVVWHSGHQQQRQISLLALERSELAERLYQNQRSLSESCARLPVSLDDLPETAANSERTNPEADENRDTEPDLPDRDVFDFAMLLLSMQDLGQRLSTDLDLSSLVPTILSTTKDVLKCSHSQLYLWNAREARLVDAASGERVDLESHRWPSPQVLNWVITQRRILTRRELLGGRLFSGIPDLSRIPAAVAPLRVGPELIGLLVVDGTEEEGATFVRMLYILTNHCALSLKNAQLFRRIEEMARRDSLTGLLNHASFLDALERLIVSARANGQALTIVMSDIDHFKKFNDTFGHQLGDKVLQSVSQWWRAILPEHAVLARYGGEEFICALPNENLDRGRELAELLRMTFDMQPVDHDGTQLHVTTSFGVAELCPSAPTANRLIQLADRALYQAKAEGRNRVCCQQQSLAEDADCKMSDMFFRY